MKGEDRYDILQTDEMSMAVHFTCPFSGSYRKMHTFRRREEMKKDKTWNVTHK